MNDPLEDDPRRSEIVLRRIARFFGVEGLCEAYERRGDHLVQLHDIANLLADTVPGVTRDAVIRRLLFSARNNWFGRHGLRQTVKQLIDLDDFSYAPRGRYSLRPSYIRVEAAPEHMRAPRSVWALWLRALRWPVPPELELEPSGSVAEGRAQDREPVISVTSDREQLLSQARAATSFNPRARRSAVCGLIYDSLWSHGCTSTEILEAAYGDPDGQVYWESWLFEPMSVHQFARLLAVLGLPSRARPPPRLLTGPCPCSMALCGRFSRRFAPLRIQANDGS